MAVTIFDNELTDAIEQSKVLVVGAGGIGCEILKNLVLSGFKNIEIIDLDTIDISNLNRQFLFHKEHVGKSKAEVAKSSALKFNPKVSIKAYHDSVMNDDYNVGYFKTFNLVLNALDNRAARNHVNRMCLAADIPLLDSGTAGYAGQVELIKKGLTQCYECQPKARQKTIPGCTIRNTPSEPAHCVMWAKHLFNQLFGEEDADNDVSPDTADPELEGTTETQNTNSGDVARRSTRGWAKDCNYDGKQIFTKLFNEDINYLLTLTPLWKARRAPEPLQWDSSYDAAVPAPSYTSNQRLWTLAECTKVFSDSITALRDELASRPDGDHLVWDKDDRSAMDFVTACTNIRARIFGIPEKSQFEVKSIAGNIIPAIATANAVVAGLAVLRAISILRGKMNAATSVYLRPQLNHRGHLFVPEKVLTPPNPKCYVCASKPEIALACNLSTLTIQGLATALTDGLCMRAPDATVEGKSTVILSSEPGESALDKTLQEMGLVDGSALIADDFLQNYEVRVCLQNDPEEKAWRIITEGTAPAPQPEPNKTENAESHRNGSPAPGPSNDKMDDNDDLEVIFEVAATAKRKLEPDDDEPNTSKRARTESEDDDIIEIN